MAALPPDGEALRLAMRHVPSPVTVVTAVGPDGPCGITIGSFTSLSLAPPLVSFNVQAQAQIYPILTQAEAFAIHVLHAGQAHLSDHFADSQRFGAAQFATIPHRLTEVGLPILHDSVAVFFCRRHAVYPGGDHALIIGEVLDVVTDTQQRPLVYFDRSYRTVGEVV